MIGDNFRYGSQWLSDYDMIMGMPNDEQQFVTRTINKGEVTSVRPRPNHYGATYEDALVLDFFIVKGDICEGQENLKLTGDDIHYLRTWLESPKKPTELVVQMQDDTLTTHYYGLFTSVQPYLNQDECYGLYLKFTCDSPYGYSDKETLTYTIGSSGATIRDTYNNKTSDLEEYIHPIITINSSSTFGANETVSIGNASDNDNSMEITLPEGLSSLTIDCIKKIVTDENGALVSLSDTGIASPISSEYSFVSTDQFDVYWFSLIPGDNNIVITPSSTNTISTIEMSLRYIIKSGGF